MRTGALDEEHLASVCQRAHLMTLHGKYSLVQLQVQSEAVSKRFHLETALCQVDGLQNPNKKNEDRDGFDSRLIEV